MMRFAMLMALGAVQGACSSAQPAGNAVASGNAANPDQGSEPTMSETRISITTDRGQLTAQLVDNEATRALVRMLPVTLQMRDHLRQEKTGNLPSPLPEQQRQLDFAAGTLGLWGNDDFVIYYRSGRVPQPGIIVLGRVSGDVSVSTVQDRPQYGSSAPRLPQYRDRGEPECPLWVESGH